MFARIRLLLVWAILFCAAIQAEPTNVLVGDLTFIRPEKWAWESPGNSKATTRFIVPTGTGQPSATDVRFYLGEKNPTVAGNTWKSFFPKATPRDVTEERQQINGRDLTYISISGAYVFPAKSKPKPNHTYLGAVIPSGDHFVHVRILGPTDEVERATPLFKKMIEDALKTKEAE